MNQELKMKKLRIQKFQFGNRVRAPVAEQKPIVEFKDKLFRIFTIFLCMCSFL